MTKAEFLATLAKLYALGNRSDSDDRPAEEGWTHPMMSGFLLCAQLDQMLHPWWARVC